MPEVLETQLPSQGGGDGGGQAAGGEPEHELEQGELQNLLMGQDQGTCRAGRQTERRHGAAHAARRFWMQRQPREDTGEERRDDRQALDQRP